MFKSTFTADANQTLTQLDWSFILTGIPALQPNGMLVDLPTDGAVKVGDIYRYVWGYGQTNVQFFQVISLTKSGRSIKLQEIDSQDVSIDKDSFSGYCVPVKNKFKGVPFIKRLNHDNTVKLAYATGRLWNGKPMFCSWGA